MVAGVTQLPKRRKVKFDRERLELRADADWIAQVEAEAGRLGLSLSGYIRLCVQERLDRTPEAKQRPKRKK
jgi:hypothetical protein